ncbi:MAG TPA: hypothetical protein VHR66_27410 [Gemmataceae bacterium]|jgi:hypothetical protein|nr:hypothetical protein [Gemmataceae bacterium]
MAGLEGKGATDLEGVFDQWFSRALPFILTKDKATSWKDFQDGWVRVCYPAGVGLADARLAVTDGPRPPEVLGYQDEPTRKLWVLCNALAGQSSDGVFYLSSRTAKEECGFGNHVTALERLKALVKNGQLEMVTPGISSATARVATRYRIRVAADESLFDCALQSTKPN